jgi:membrane-associated phospholipid phosphatase
MEEIKKKSIKSFLKKLPLEFLLLAGLFVGAIFLFALIAHEVVFEKEAVFDNKVIDFLSPYTTKAFIGAMKFFTFFGSSKFLFPAYTLLIAYYLIKRRIILGVHIAVIAITSTALSFGAKQIFHRARPDLPLIKSLKTYSFPSGHALSSFIFCGILIYLLWRANIQPVWKWVFAVFLFLFSITIGISRIVLKVHYPTDVFAGFCFGFAWVMLSFYFLNRIWPKPQLSDSLPEKDTRMPETG